MAPQDSRGPLTVLHTNDLHNHLGIPAAEAISRIYAEAEGPKLLIDAGDAGGSTNITYRPAGEPVLERMSQLGYIAMTLGNRDFHVTRAGLRAKLFRASFPILCANIRPSRPALNVGAGYKVDEALAASGATGEPNLLSHIVHKAGGWRILLFGLTVPMVTERMWERRLSAYVFEPPVRVAARILPELRAWARPDLVIALTHIGLRLDRELAGTVAGIDLIVGGHSHEVLPHGETVGDTLIVQAGSHGHFLGVVTIAQGGDERGRPSITARLEPI
jgi:2',3'-cyclic-nucleotide 2'-phosphodiesterase (5'-nucleotidase family)